MLAECLQVPESPDLPHGDEEFRLRESAASSTTIKNETTTRAQPDPATSRSDERLEAVGRQFRFTPAWVRTLGPCFLRLPFL